MSRIGPQPFKSLLRHREVTTAGCWEWTGARNPTGYGHMNYRSGYPHRVAYELMVGPIPKGLTIDHLCRNRACFNPQHLEAVSLRENIMRSPTALAAINARRTNCKRGHLFDGKNTIARPNGTGRECRACKKISDARRYALRITPP